MSGPVKVKWCSKGKGDIEAGAGADGQEVTATACRWLRNCAQALKKINFN